MKAQQKFNKSLLATSISVLLCGAVAMPASAQQSSSDDDSLEVIQVSGLRSSLEASTAVKRDSAGVVDAISAEDMGKFPDTNLAESLQRISGVSISRTNGEGSEVTVRGFGAGNNMVTLNGRMMPAGGVYPGSTGATRAFDFANLASESVSAVEVYKTSKASIATGGIGATINVLTAKPLDNPGTRASVGVKAVHDTTNRAGDDLTPELSGIVSWTDDDAKFGVALSLSVQERHSGYTGVTVNNWNIGAWGTNDLYNNQFDAAVFENAPDPGQLFARPDDMRYVFSDTERTRTNGQLTLQYALSDDITATLDYTYAENDIQEHRGELGNWLQNGDNVVRVVFDDNAVATPISVSEEYGGSVDQGYEQQWRQRNNELSSIGFNIEYQVNDDLNLRLDIHDSSLDSLPTGPSDSEFAASEIKASIGAPTVVSKTLTFDGEIPIFVATHNDCLAGANCNGVLDVGDVGSSIGIIDYVDQKTDVTQIKLDGTYEFDEGQFDFGIETRAMEMQSKQSAWLPMNLGGWSIGNPGEFPEGMIQPFDLSREFDDYNVGNSNTGFIGNPIEMMRFILDLYPDPNNNFYPNPIFSNNDIVEEDTTAVYFQFATEAELGGMPVNFLAGLRYETTDLTSSSFATPPEYLIWASDNDFSSFTDPSAVATLLQEENSYDHMLPSMDFDIMLTDDLKGRFSYSKTISRAGYGSLRVSPNGFSTNGATINGAIPTASAANPSLLPLESDNLDLSLEYYYDDSYVSVGVFEKRVANFIGNGQVDMPHAGILDQTNGPRAQAAAAELVARGFAVNNRSLFTMMGVIQSTGSAAAYDGSEAQVQAIELAVDILPEAGDPEMIFRTSLPQNNKEAKIYGAEFAVQHFFGDTGFGAQANYTIVRGDVKFNNEGAPDTSQFALVGLSDTANLVGFYEKDGFQARVAWNWRDDYLDQVNRGSSNNPSYIEAYSQIDINVSYELTENLSLFVEGINVTGENSRTHARNERQIWSLADLGARYQFGARYNF